ncbi:hypothetical protein GCM10010250_02190 [Streptomyces althioticus]|nr:hypothetical protein GCM10010250_02190 [Streptomyces althioticus]
MVVPPTSSGVVDRRAVLWTSVPRTSVLWTDDVPVDYFFSTAWPPNWFRSAAIIFICGESS